MSIFDEGQFLGDKKSLAAMSIMSGNPTGAIGILKGGSKGERAALALGWFTAYGGLRSANNAQRTADQAALDAANAGVAAQGRLAEGRRQAERAAQEGQAKAQAEYQRQLQEAQRYQQSLQGLFSQEREAGDAAMQQLNQTLMGGDMSGLAIDPYYETQRLEGERALERQASAQGYYGGGAHFRQLGRFNQELASSEYDAAIQRLMGVAQTGQNATAAYGQFNQNAANNMLGIYGAQADLSNRGGQYMGAMRQNFATAGANVLNRQATASSNYDMQAANARAWGAQQVNNSIQQGAALGGYLYDRNQAPAQQQPASNDFSIRNPVV